jgi:hypothetical protein
MRSLHTNNKMQLVSGLAACLFTLFGCGPGGAFDGGDGDVTSETGDNDTGTDTVGDGDGDGDPGDGDGDGCNMPTPTVMCTDTECWASDPGWTADAAATTDESMAPLLEAGIWVPVNLDVGDQCWNLHGTDRNVCIVDICGEHLLGQPADELPLELSPACDFVGVWESTWTAFDTCFGVIDGVAVELRSPAPAPGEMWGPCPVSDQGTIDLCNSEDLACVPAADGTANICLPLGSCPDVVPLGIFGELGWGEACYPRCGQNSECFDGQICAMSDADGGSVCAWPFACESNAAIECDDLNRCWAHEDGWPAQAQWADPADIQAGVDAGTLEPVDLGNGVECYILDGADYNPCVVRAGCTPLLGRPLLQLNLVASDCAAVGGPWSWVGEGVDASCWGLVDGIAVQLTPLGLP